MGRHSSLLNLSITYTVFGPSYTIACKSVGCIFWNVVFCSWKLAIDALDCGCARFAKAPTAIRTDWNEFTKDYFLKRETLVCVFLLVDSSIEPQQIDLDCIDWLGRKKVTIDNMGTSLLFSMGCPLEGRSMFNSFLRATSSFKFFRSQSLVVLFFWWDWSFFGIHLWETTWTSVIWN